MYVSDLKHPNSSLEDKLNTLYHLNRGERLELGFRPQYLSLLDKLGNPHLHLPPTVHVAGTNGKGSSIAMMRAILESAGYCVHVYTSPHLTRFNERIVLAGHEINDAKLESMIDEILAHNDGADVSFFEITTALAFAAFSRSPADILLLETGLGGRLDCSNIIPASAACLISAIGLDHQDFLGNTIGAIASEKAGILKTGTPCVIARQPHQEALSVLQTQAQTLGVDCHYADAYEVRADGFTLHLPDQTLILPRPALIGDHQIDNAAAAITTLWALRAQFPIMPVHIESGLAQARWPARLQNITARVDSLPKGWEIRLDGGHNADAADALVAYIEQQGRDTHLICAMMDHKDSATFLSHLAPHIVSLHCVPIPSEHHAMPPEALQQASPDYPIQTHPSWRDAIDAITQSAENGQIIICGSLYLAGHILSA